MSLELIKKGCIVRGGSRKREKQEELRAQLESEEALTALSFFCNVVPLLIIFDVL